MPRIDWLLVCELAYFDRQNRLCTVGITTQFIVPSLPVSLREIMLVGRIVGPQPGSRIDVGVAVSTPDGQWISPNASESLHIEVVSDYVVATLRDVPLNAEGTYHFGVFLDPEDIVSVDVPVFLLPDHRPAEVH